MWKGLYAMNTLYKGANFQKCKKKSQHSKTEICLCLWTKSQYMLFLTHCIYVSFYYQLIMFISRPNKYLNMIIFSMQSSSLVSSQEAALHQELHPHEPFRVVHPESNFCLHQRQCALRRGRQWPLLHTYCKLHKHTHIHTQVFSFSWWFLTLLSIVPEAGVSSCDDILPLLRPLQLLLALHRGSVPLHFTGGDFLPWEEILLLVHCHRLGWDL